MRLTRDLKSLTNLQLTAALALAFGASARATQVAGGGAQPAASAAALLDTIKAVDSDPTPREARERTRAVEGLKRMGAAAVPAIAEFLSREKGTPRVYAAEALAGIDSSSALARAALTDVAREGKGDEVIAAAVILAELDPENDAAVPALVKALADKDEIVSGMAAEALEQFGAEAIPELKRAAAGHDRKVAAAAAELLKQMGRD